MSLSILSVLICLCILVKPWKRKNISLVSYLMALLDLSFSPFMKFRMVIQCCLLFSQMVEHSSKILTIGCCCYANLALRCTCWWCQWLACIVMQWSHVMALVVVCAKLHRLAWPTPKIYAFFISEVPKSQKARAITMWCHLFVINVISCFLV